MNLSDINWDPNEAGAWPLPIKAATILVICALVFGVGVYYDTLDQLTALDVSEKKELELKQSFETKQKNQSIFRIIRINWRRLKQSWRT